MSFETLTLTVHGKWDVGAKAEIGEPVMRLLQLSTQSLLLCISQFSLLAKQPQNLSGLQK